MPCPCFDATAFYLTLYAPINTNNCLTSCIHTYFVLLVILNATNHNTQSLHHMHLLNRRVAWFWPQIQMVFAHLVRRVQPRGGTVRIALPSDEWVYGRAVQTHQTNHGGGAQQTQQRSDERDPVLLVQACRSLGNSGWVKHSFFDQCLFNAFLLVLVFQVWCFKAERLLQRENSCKETPAKNADLFYFRASLLTRRGHIGKPGALCGHRGGTRRRM